MAVYTKILRHLNAKWFVNSAKDGCLFCGVSKSTLQLTDQEPNLSTVLNSCEVFSKLYVQFVESSTSEDYDVKLLTKQIYNKNENNSSFNSEEVCYWKFVSEQEALEKSIYNTVAFFVLENTNTNTYNSFKDLKSFYFLLNLKVNNVTPNEQVIYDDEKTYTADYIIVVDRLSISPDGDFGCCESVENGISVPNDFKMKFNYFVSF